MSMDPAAGRRRMSATVLRIPARRRWAQGPMRWQALGLAALAGGALGLLVLRVGTLAPPQPASRADVAATGRASVIDGDTIEIRGARIRLVGIDAPESGQACRDRANGARVRCGQRAAHHLDAVIAGRSVACVAEGRDSYGRTLARCRAGDTDLGDAMVRAGWALAFVRYSQDYVGAERAAREARRGLWAYEFEAPWDWRAAARERPAQDHRT